MANIPAVCPKCGNKTFKSPRAKPEANDYLICTKCGTGSGRNNSSGR
jgi:predicted RNA-binding Zn-ribbon protein involved in translation (DUF1610 family)